MSKPSFEPTMERQRNKSLNFLGLFGLLVAIVYVNPLAKIYPSIPSPIGSYSEKVTGSALNPSVHNLAAQYRKGCPEHQFTSVKLLSRAPDIFIIDGFVTNAEAEFLVKAA
jgi:hypothetical protein